MQNYGYSPYSYGQPYGYPSYQQRYAPQPQQVAQPMQPQPQPQMPQTSPQIQGVSYGTEEEAKAFIVFPNSIAYFIDHSKNRLYAKSANASGVSSIDYFSIFPINADGTPIKPQEQTPQINIDDFSKRFVSVEQYEELVNRFEELKKFIGGRQNGSTAKPTENKV